MIRKLVLAVILLSLPGCTYFDVLNAAIPVRGSTLTSDISYGTFPRRKLDVYRPHKVSAPAPVIVFFYGGYWTSGDKHDYRFAAQAFTSRGFVVVIPNYRLIPAVKFPDFVDDGALAVKWTHDHIADFGGDANRIYLTGHSAGGHIALLLALDEHYLHDVGLDTHVIKAVAPIAAPTDFVPPPELRFAFGLTLAAMDGSQNPEIEPIHFARKDAPPTLIVQGLKDTTVRPENAVSLQKHLADAGAEVDYIAYPTLDHVGAILSVWWPLSWRATIADEIARFFNEHR